MDAGVGGRLSHEQAPRNPKPRLNTTVRHKVCRKQNKIIKLIRKPCE